jgi:hypothetical protein
MRRLLTEAETQIVFRYLQLRGYKQKGAPNVGTPEVISAANFKILCLGQPLSMATSTETQGVAVNSANSPRLLDGSSFSSLSIRKSLACFPSFIASVSHFGFNPRPVQVSP